MPALVEHQQVVEAVTALTDLGEARTLPGCQFAEELENRTVRYLPKQDLHRIGGDARASTDLAWPLPHDKAISLRRGERYELTLVATGNKRQRTPALVQLSETQTGYEGVNGTISGIMQPPINLVVR